MAVRLFVVCAASIVYYFEGNEMFWWQHRVSLHSARRADGQGTPCRRSSGHGIQNLSSGPVSIPTRACDGGFAREPWGEGLWKVQSFHSACGRGSLGGFV
ncbi:hypothetical protein B0T18DRAFT_243624 [Schizothecium vesticola]|uniref:Uncharacterized protein n=1 Tax=Schizothecium vesticola TaxID=314040 RepID=A0AA40BQ33_9PEZI|nr:hypothetical protein B0T18DRAFT_243624 [Schizothecium vesticola]